MENRVSFWRSKRAAVYLFVLLDIVYVVFVLMGGQVMPLGRRLQLLGLMLVATILYVLLVPERFYQNSNLVQPHWKNQVVVPSSGKGWLLFGLWALSSIFLLAPYRLDVNYQTSQNFWFYESTYVPVLLFGITGWQIIVARFKSSDNESKLSKLEDHDNEN